jgi:hypothetical protein
LSRISDSTAFLALLEKAKEVGLEATNAVARTVSI